MSIFIEFPITSEMTVRFSPEELKNMIDKRKQSDASDSRDIESRIADSAMKTIQEHSNDDQTGENNDAYKNILKRDAETRLRQCFGTGREISVNEFVSWCWQANAGHWPDGTPICDDKQEAER